MGWRSERGVKRYKENEEERYWVNLENGEKKIWDIWGEWEDKK